MTPELEPSHREPVRCLLDGVRRSRTLVAGASLVTNEIKVVSADCDLCNNSGGNSIELELAAPDEELAPLVSAAPRRGWRSSASALVRDGAASSSVAISISLELALAFEAD